MGVKGLNQYMLKNISKETKTIQKIYTNQLKDKKIVIDASIYIYKYFVNNDYGLLNANLNKMITDFKQNRITPIFVFDGTPIDKKDPVIIKRREEKLKFMEENEGSTDNAIQLKLQKCLIKPNKKTVDYVKTVLDKNGIKYINAPNEADPICALLVNNGTAWACLSDDTDLFIYKCSRVLRSYSIHTKSMMLYDLDKIMKYLNVNIDEFREICIVSGTDYNIEDNIDINKVFSLYYEYKDTKDIIHTTDTTFISWLRNNKYIVNDEVYYDVLHLMDTSTEPL
jgi:5'-3' exonuclease